MDNAEDEEQAETAHTRRLREYAQKAEAAKNRFHEELLNQVLGLRLAVLEKISELMPQLKNPEYAERFLEDWKYWGLENLENSRAIALNPLNPLAIREVVIEPDRARLMGDIAFRRYDDNDERFDAIRRGCFYKQTGRKIKPEDKIPLSIEDHIELTKRILNEGIGEDSLNRLGRNSIMRILTTDFFGVNFDPTRGTTQAFDYLESLWEILSSKDFKFIAYKSEGQESINSTASAFFGPYDSQPEIKK